MKIANQRSGLAVALALGLGLCLAVPAKADYYDDAVLTFRHGDYLDAFVMFDKLARQGDTRAQFMIGTMWYEGKGKPQNYREAYRWYLRSAYRGNADSQNNLGLIYQKGEVEATPNPVVAYAWFALAAAQNNEVARNNLDALSEQLKHDRLDARIIEGQTLAQEYSARIDAEKRHPRPAGPAASYAAAAGLTPHGFGESGEVYKVQLGLFGQSQNIKRLRSQLRKLHYRFEDTMVEFRGRTYHQFRIGAPYATIQEAEDAQQKVDRAFKIQSAIIPLLR
jgi:TPR repeat protein